MKTGLTMSMIFEAQSANYGEGSGNIASLKHLTRSGGNGYTYISRQAMRYSIVQQLGWDKTPVEANGSGDKAVIQYHPNATIIDYPEIDLFGYMKTIKGKGAITRSAVARLSNAVSLEPYNNDMDFLVNMGLAKRIDASNSIAQSEIHQSFYAYTITIDLDRVGVDNELQISNQDRANRVVDLLTTVQYLYRDIKGRRENMAPIFAVGGVYERKSPFFENRLKLNKQILDVDMLQETMVGLEKGTVIGYVTGSFANDEQIKNQLHPVNMAKFFQQISHEVEAAYDESH